MAQVITAIDEKVSVTRCDGRGDCQDGEPCLTHDLWSDLSNQIYSFLEGISLGSLVERRSIQEIAERQGAGKGKPVIPIAAAP